MIQWVRRQTLWLALLCFSVLGISPIAMSDGGSEDCSGILSASLRFDVRVSGRIDPQTPISIRIGEAATLLAFRYDEFERGISQDTRLACRDQRQQVLTDLLSFFRERLRWLIEQGRPDECDLEYQNILAWTINGKQRAYLRERIEPPEQGYLVALHSSLIRSLAQTGWAAYGAIPVELANWNQEWASVFRREVPAGVVIDNGTIVARAFDQSPDVLRIFVFHEIAHLADPDARTHYSEYTNELFAWQQTLEYLTFLEQKGAAIPRVFQRIQKNVGLLGLERWVELIIGSRSPRTN